MLDRDVAELYETTTGQTNRAAKRNPRRFPEPSYRFKAVKSELCQIGTVLQKRGLTISGPHPWLYTQHGCNALAFVLNSDIAIERSVQIVETFTALEQGRLEEYIAERVAQATRGDEIKRLLLLGAPADWSERFPREFWVELARLRHWHKYDPDKHNTPQDAKWWVSWTIYQRLPSNVYDALKEMNPADENGNRSHKHHQFMRTSGGDEVLKNLVREALRFMRTSIDWSDFAWRWDQLRPRPGQQLKMFPAPKPSLQPAV